MSRIKALNGAVDPERSRRARESVQKGQAEQAAGRKLLLALGAKVYAIGTTRRRTDYQGTMQTPGMPDIKFFIQARGASPRRRGVWWESKAGTGRLSPAQREFRDLATSSGEDYIAGDVDALIVWLCAEGYARANQFAHYRTEAR